MRQTLLWIPEKIDWLGGMPVFGLGLLLIIWAVFSVGLVAWLVRRQGWNDDTRGYVPILLVIGAGIVFAAPWIVQSGAGLPIRGYGVMVALGVLAGVGLSAWQARRMGLDPQVIYSLAFWMLLGGFLGARAFYIIQYWDQFQRETAWLMLVAIADFTKGGLVVYGSVIGGIAALVAFCRVCKLPVLAIGDLIALGMLVGLALGRVGCLLNGCCYGGVCEEKMFPPAIRFPRLADARAGKLSDPYAHQQSLGLLHGFRVDADTDGRPVVAYVRPDWQAGRLGLGVGQVIRRIELDPLSATFAALSVSELAGGELEVELESGETIAVPIAPRSGPTPVDRSENEIGFELRRLGPGEPLVIESVTEGSLAQQAGLKSGQRVERIGLPEVTSLAAARGILMHAERKLVLTRADSGRYDVSLDAPPQYSRPVHPTQIYSSIKASLLALFLWSYYPFRRRDGEVFALMLLLYPLFRILLEVIRDDVPGLLGTPITISQAVSGAVFLAGLGLWIHLSRQPRGSALPPS